MWATQTTLRTKLIDFVRAHLANQLTKQHQPIDRLIAARTVLRATPYSAARSLSLGSRRVCRHSPDSIRLRSESSTLRETSFGIGDPACDTVIAWTFLSGSSRDRFRAERDLDSRTWSRGRGWALWKALITLAAHLESGAPEAAVPRREITRIVGDYAHDR